MLRVVAMVRAEQSISFCWPAAPTPAGGSRASWAPGGAGASGGAAGRDAGGGGKGLSATIVPRLQAGLAVRLSQHPPLQRRHAPHPRHHRDKVGAPTAAPRRSPRPGVINLTDKLPMM